MQERTAQALHKMRNRNTKFSPEEGQEEARERPQECQKREDREEKEEEEKGEIDNNIPEHYPNSPLCPANAKYWRFVDGKLRKEKYTRTCWMHSELKD